MKLIPFPKRSKEPDSSRRTVRELCREYVTKQLSVRPLAESRHAIRLLKTYVFPVIGDLDQSEVSLKALGRLYAYASTQGEGEADAKAAVSLVAEIFWELASDSSQRKDWIEANPNQNLYPN